MYAYYNFQTNTFCENWNILLLPKNISENEDIVILYVLLYLTNL